MTYERCETAHGIFLFFEEPCMCARVCVSCAYNIIMNLSHKIVMNAKKEKYLYYIEMIK